MPQCFDRGIVVGMVRAMLKQPRTTQAGRVIKRIFQIKSRPVCAAG